MKRRVICADGVLERPGGVLVILTANRWSLPCRGSRSRPEAGCRDARANISTASLAWSGDARNAAFTGGDGHGGRCEGTSNGSVRAPERVQLDYLCSAKEAHWGDCTRMCNSTGLLLPLPNQARRYRDRTPWGPLPRTYEGYQGSWLCVLSQRYSTFVSFTVTVRLRQHLLVQLL